MGTTCGMPRLKDRGRSESSQLVAGLLSAAAISMSRWAPRVDSAGRQLGGRLRKVDIHRSKFTAEFKVQAAYQVIDSG